MILGMYVMCVCM